jgi:hypothetical protein
MRLLLLGKAAVLVHRFERPLAAEMDEMEQRRRTPLRLLRRCSLARNGAAPQHQRGSHRCMSARRLNWARSAISLSGGRQPRGGWARQRRD